MHYILYIDVYFLVNFFMNTVLLWLFLWSGEKRNTLTKRKQLFRILLGAFAGGVLSCLLVLWFPGLSFFVRLVPVNVSIGCLMVWIAFDYRGVKQRLLAVLRLWLLELLLSGALNLFLGQSGYILFCAYQAEKQEELHFLSVMGVAAFTALLFKTVFGYYRREKQLCKHLYEVKLFHKGRSYEGIGLLDTGNHLREPITGRAVVIADQRAARELFGCGEAERIASFCKNQNTEKLPENRVKWIPYHSLGEQHGFMPGVLIDQMIICREEGEQMRKEVLIGISEEELSREGLYELILHEEYFWQ